MWLDELPSVDLSIEDVAVLCGVIGIDPPSGWRSALDTTARDLQATVAGVVKGSLRARRLLTDGRDGEEIHEAVRATLELCAAPRCLMRFQSRNGPIHRTVSVAVHADAAVVQRDLPGRVCRFTPIMTTSVLRYLADLSGFQVSRDEVAEPCEIVVSNTAYERGMELIEAGRPDAATSVLGGAAASAFVESSAAADLVASALVIHRPAPGIVAGGALSWLACGSSVWIVPEREALDRSLPYQHPTIREVSIRRAGAAEVWSELRSYFPDDVTLDVPELIGAP